MVGFQRVKVWFKHLIVKWHGHGNMILSSMGFLEFFGAKQDAYLTHTVQMFSKSLLVTDYWDSVNALNPFPTFS